MIRPLLLSAFLMTVAGNSALAADQSIDLCRQRSSEILQALQKKDFAAATTHFDTRVKSALNAEQLSQIWNQLLPKQLGPYDHADAAQIEPNDGGAIATTLLHFANGLLSMKVGCDSAGNVSALFFAPSKATPAAREAYPFAANEHALSVASPLGPLPGTLTLPAGNGPFPAVLLIAGSGPNDRDETILENKPFRDLAQGLAAAGIASLRYDKRTRVYGAKMAGKPITVDDEVTNDAVTAFHQLAAHAAIDPHRVFVLGHSLGGLMAPRIGQRVPEAAGLILLAGPASMDLDRVLRQTRYIAAQHDVTGAALDRLTAPIITARNTLAKASASHPPAGMFFHAPASYWLSLRGYDAVATAKSLHMPMLILQGERDYQVTPEMDFARWRAALSNDKRVQLKFYPGLSHLFMPGSNPPSPDDYQRAGHVDAHVIEDISTWILAQRVPSANSAR